MGTNRTKIAAAVASLAVTAAILASQAFLAHSAAQDWVTGSAAIHEAANPQTQQASVRHPDTRG